MERVVKFNKNKQGLISFRNNETPSFATTHFAASYKVRPYENLVSIAKLYYLANNTILYNIKHYKTIKYNKAYK